MESIDSSTTVAWITPSESQIFPILWLIGCRLYTQNSSISTRREVLASKVYKAFLTNIALWVSEWTYNCCCLKQDINRNLPTQLIGSAGRYKRPSSASSTPHTGAAEAVENWGSRSSSLRAGIKMAGLSGLCRICLQQFTPCAYTWIFIQSFKYRKYQTVLFTPQCCL